MASNLPQGPDVPLDFGGQQVPTNLGPIIKWAAALLGLILLFALLSFLRSIYTDLLWFDAMGFRSIFVKILLTRIVMFAVGALIFAALLSTSLYFAHRYSRGEVHLELPPEAIDLLRKLVVWGAVAVVVVLSVIFGSIFAARWELFLRFSNAVPFGTTDPLFGRDLSFYLFTLPIYSFVQGWLLGAAVMIMLATVALHLVNFSLRGAGFKITDPLKIHFSIIGAVLMLVLASGHWLDRWELVVSDHGAVVGAAYADVNARKPALLILTIIAGASGLLMLGNAYLRGVRLLVGAAALWIVLAIVLAGVWPALMQQLTVNPNEFLKEARYISRNISFTRSGFAIADVEERFYPAESSVTAELLRNNRQTVNNIRLWDYRPLSNVYKQIQLIRPYYDFKDADVDRYTIGGEYRQVLLAAREVAPEKLDEDTRTWINQRLIYTHGIGLAMSPATDFTQEGRPEFFAKDIPTDGIIPIGALSEVAEPEIVVRNPRIYYGENTVDYVVVNTNTDELDYRPDTGEEVRTRYFGTGGVRLSSFIKRLAYAWQLADVNLLISDEITGDSLIQYRRQITERISTVAPFLVLDKDPYIVATDGNLFWIQDAYTVADHYPYSDFSQDAEGLAFNYIRNSVKVVVDAFNGTLQFYLWDEDDPVVRTYAKMFPDLFLTKSEMPDSLREHVRYPQDFFAIQAEKYIKYHMREPETFYNNEDLWAVPNEKFGQTENLRPVEPYYVIMKLPDQDREEFVLLLPYTPNQRQNLIGWLAARSDGDHYGKLVAFNFPKDRQIDGPEQVEARIDADQDISAWFTLRCAQGSICIRGNLLVIPVGDSILYAEPVYIQAESVTFPELKRVILATGEKVVMENSLPEAVASLTGRASSAGIRSSNGAPGGAGPPAAVAGLEEEIKNLSDAIEFLKDNLAQLEEARDRLKQLTAGE